MAGMYDNDNIFIDQWLHTFTASETIDCVASGFTDKFNEICNLQCYADASISVAMGNDYMTAAKTINPMAYELLTIAELDLDEISVTATAGATVRLIATGK